MALPTLADKIDAVKDKIEKESIISEIAKAVFKSAKISMESAAKAVVPSVPEMVNEVLDDLKSGSIQKFNLAMDKLDKLVRTLGIDLKQYNKELANFAARREEKITKSEEKIQLLKEKNIIAEIKKSGDIKILSNREIENKKNDLKLLEKNIAKLEKSLEKDRKLLQESDKLKTRAQANKKEEVKQNILKLDNMKKERETEKQILGERGEPQPGIFQRGRERVGSFVDEYVPDPIADVGNAMVEGFMAPINAVKDLGKSFGQLLKPLKLLRPLFTGLLGTLKKFALGLKASIIAMLPQIALGAVILTVLGLIFLAIKKIRDFLGLDNEKTGPYDMGNQETDVLDEPPPVAEYGNFGSRMQRKGFHADTGGDEMEFIQPDDPRYDELYEKKYNKPAPEKGQVYMGDGKVAILPIDKTGQMHPMELRKMEAEGFKLKPNPLLSPIDKKETGDSANISTTTSQIVNQNTTTTVTGISGPRDIDMEIFYLANPLYR